MEDYSFVTNVSTCPDAVAEMIGDNYGLLYYSHIPTAIIALFIGILVLYKSKDRLSAVILFLLTLSFSIWSTLDLITWVSFDSRAIMFSWALLGIFDVSMFILTLYFVYVFIDKKDVSFKIKSIFFALLAPIILMTPTLYNLDSFLHYDCAANDLYFLRYIFYVEGVVSLWMVIVLISRYIKASIEGRKKILLLFAGTVFFLFSFFTTGFIAEYLLSINVTSAYGVEIYGLFGMTIFMGFLAYLIVKFKAFNIKLLGAQALVWALVITIGAEFFFVESIINNVLVAVTLVISSILGLMLVRGVKREIAARELIEKREKELEIANEGQSNLLHFIAHQVKGYFTKSRFIFQGLVDGDFGQLPKESNEIIKEGFKSATEGVDLVQNVLNAANIEKGTVKYTMESVNLTEAVADVIKHKMEQINDKGLELKQRVTEEDLFVSGDALQLKEVVKNLIDNAIRYTPKGTLTISLSENDGMALFYIKDTGVGITVDDMKKLFKKGGHGEDSSKINPESTGYGLYIVKGIVEQAHKGRVWAESDGKGTGSTFFVQLPIEKK